MVWNIVCLKFCTDVSSESKVYLNDPKKRDYQNDPKKDTNTIVFQGKASQVMFFFYHPLAIHGYVKNPCMLGGQLNYNKRYSQSSFFFGCVSTEILLGCPGSLSSDG